MASAQAVSNLFSALVLGAPLGGAQAVASIRAGYPAKMLKAVSRFFGVPEARIQKVAQVPATTANRLMKKKVKLDSSATERIFRLGVITRRTIEVFEDKDAAIEWMCTKNRALADVAPLDLMDTEPGAASVREILNAIETGGVA